VKRLLRRDDQWERIQDLLTGKASDRGVTAEDNRLFVEALLWITRTGAPPWRDLPAEFGPWNLMYRRFSRAAQLLALWCLVLHRQLVATLSL
jgi:transposase